MLAMTAVVIIAGLLPIMVVSGTGSEVMKRIMAPMIGWRGPRPAGVADRDSGAVLALERP